jgi:hypothetical protein
LGSNIINQQEWIYLDKEIKGFPQFIEHVILCPNYTFLVRLIVAFSFFLEYSSVAYLKGGILIDLGENLLIFEDAELLEL